MSTRSNGASDPVAPHPKSPHHMANGQFAPGNRASPGRPSKAQELATLTAIGNAVPPERLEQLINDAIALATAPGRESPRTLLAILEFCVSNQLGRPGVRVAEGDGDGLETFLQRLRDA